MRLGHLLALMLLALGLLAWPTAVRADEYGDFELAKNHYKNGEYEQAIVLFKKVFAKPIDPADPKAMQRRKLFIAARPYYAAALLGVGQVDFADEVIHDQLRDDPYYKDKIPRGFPPTLTERFIRVYDKHRGELDAIKKQIEDRQMGKVQTLEQIRKAKEDRLKKLEQMAAEEKIIVNRSRLIAMIPFGVGQFQNDDLGLGLFFAGSELGFIAANIATAAVFQNDKEEFLTECVNKSSTAIDCDASEGKLDGLQVANLVTFGSAVVLAIAGIIEAQVTIETQSVEVKKRPIPPPVKEPGVTLEPTGGASDSGFTLGIKGRF